MLQVQSFSVGYRYKYIFISAWALALSVQQDQAMREASMSGTGNKEVPTLELSFVLYSTDNQYSIMIDQQGCSQMFPVDL